ncbi:hypothetical protein PBCV1_a253aR [Paramecium bursaria Chlorella virus 1]|uniref:Uncharacterized protein n=1 Tax=Paramecium bursaria Chlorella virus 1 TaxID=10506 RepID=F8TU08_PBCV1|nr:hypothetical protein PBCV1_a253aR [Paramecium bursaria Chlorella virus 1]AEI70069.1 hypothetical protein [Paramecium bursaria Chlorella virus 1]
MLPKMTLSRRLKEKYQIMTGTIGYRRTSNLLIRYYTIIILCTSF